MPRYLSLLSLPPALKPLIRPLRPVVSANPLERNPTPSDILLSLPTDRMPPNIRVQEWVDDRKFWTGVGTVERLGGKKRKDVGKGREGAGREARKLGGLKWALRER